MKSTLVLLLVCGVAAADVPTEAEQAYNEGQRAFDVSQYGEAIRAWQRSYALSNAPGLLYNLAQAYRLSGDCATAVDYYERFITLDPTSAQRPLAERFEAETRPCARRDGVPAPVVPPTQVVAAPPIVIVTSAPRSPSQLKQRLGLGLGVGGGVALVGLGFYYGHRADTLGAAVTNACATRCDWAVYGPKHDAGRSAETRQYVFVGVGIAAVIGGGALYWWGSRETKHLAVVPRADGAALTWSRTW